MPLFSPTPGNTDAQVCLINRVEKAKTSQFNWFHDTVKAGLPRINEKLGIIHPLARHFSVHENLDGFDMIFIESEEWQKGKQDFIRHGLSAAPDDPSQIQIRSTYPDEPPPSGTARGRTLRGRSLGVGRRRL